MIVERRTFNINLGRMPEAIELVRKYEAQRREDGYTGGFRIYVSSIGKYNQLAMEAEHESLAEYEKALAQWSARPSSPAFMEKWNPVCPGGTNEIWRVPD